MFKYDSPLMTGLRKILNLILVSLVWLLLCIPVVTAGASTTAFYHTIEKYMKYDLGYAMPEFIGSFKSNFKTATLCWLWILGGVLVCLLDLAAVRTLADKGSAVGFMDVIFYILLALLAVYFVWVCGCTARIDNTVKETMKNALILMIAYLPSSLGILALIGACILVVWLIPATVLLMPGVTLWFASYMMEKIFVKYRKEGSEPGKDEGEPETEESLETDKKGVEDV